MSGRRAGRQAGSGQGKLGVGQGKLGVVGSWQQNGPAKAVTVSAFKAGFEIENTSLYFSSPSIAHCRLEVVVVGLGEAG